MPKRNEKQVLKDAQREFLEEWGMLGPAWGVNRTMSQIHALLMIRKDPMNTDQIMEELGISRGNAHKGLKDLLSWGLLKSTKIAGDRKDYYFAEKDVWVVIQRITRERKRKELVPVLDTLDRLLERTRGLRSAESKAFRKQLKELQDFASLADRVMERIASGKSGVILPWLLKFLT